MAVTDISIYADIRSKKSLVKPTYSCLFFHLGAQTLNTSIKSEVLLLVEARLDCLASLLVERK
jgi:hypothetical protein